MIEIRLDDVQDNRVQGAPEPAVGSAAPIGLRDTPPYAGVSPDISSSVCPTALAP